MDDHTSAPEQVVKASCGQVSFEHGRERIARQAGGARICHLFKVSIGVMHFKTVLWGHAAASE